MKPSKSILKKARKLAKSFGCKLYLNKRIIKENGNPAGFAYPWKSEIYVDPTLNLVEFTTAVFHEIQHCLNFRNKKYLRYHSGNATKADYRRWGLRAELYTDKHAKKLAKSFGFTTYQNVYSNTKYWKNYFKERFS